MSSKSKVGIGILVALLVVLIGIYVLVDAVYVPEKEAVVYPEGELVESVFVAQNNQYVENDSLGTTHSFETIPYKVDVPTGTGAKIGTGTVYQVGSGYFVYVSEYTDQYDVQDVISSQFPVALLINYVPESTRITVQQQKNGYINGFKAQYLADTLYVTDGVTQAEAIVLGYALDVPEGTYFGNHMFIAVGTTTISSESASACSQVLSTIMKTVRYDEALEAALVKAKEAEEEVKKKEEAEALKAEEEAARNADNIDSSTTITGDEVTESVPVVVPSNYKTFELSVDWTMNNPDVVLEFFFPDGSTYASPLSQTDYSAKFSLSNVSAGTYSLRIMNYKACGEIATTISGITVDESATTDTSN